MTCYMLAFLTVTSKKLLMQRKLGYGDCSMLKVVVESTIVFPAELRGLFLIKMMTYLNDVDSS